MEKEDIVINGKAQVVEILKRLPEDHKNKILKSLKIKNSTLAYELSWQTLTFLGITALSDEKISLILEYVSSPIIAIALADQSPETQKKFLSSLRRDRAKEVFSRLRSEHYSQVNITKAQNKILDITTTLLQKRTLMVD